MIAPYYWTSGESGLFGLRVGTQQPFGAVLHFSDVPCEVLH